jgi:hypothetical protein
VHLLTLSETIIARRRAIQTEDQRCTFPIRSAAIPEALSQAPSTKQFLDLPTLRYIRHRAACAFTARYNGTLSLALFLLTTSGGVHITASPGRTFISNSPRRGSLATHHMRSPPTSPSLSRVIFRSDTSHQNMSPRTADRSMPSISSPLSPRSQPLDIPSQVRRRPGMNVRQSNNNGPAAHLRLPSLPRFHPANYASSQSSSQANTPNAGPDSPYSPTSPRSGNRQYEVQRQMYLYQQQLLTNTSRHHRGMGKPTSPRLEPLASPGAVTPLELEGDMGGYLTAGVNRAEAQQHVEKLIQKEARRRGEYSPGRATSVGGS